ncbi:TIGR03067 domain-containing protein [Tundrisphaera lichenicola]|uniref:TIGR03067 domain-containing protein n=1 Tax=Tundrisphaera lichenicola TaxID=2029860 RepID=UPI003EB767CD
MRRELMALVAAVAVLGSGAAPDEVGDLNRLQGQWEASVGRRKEFVVSLEVKGSEVSATITPKIGPKVKANGQLELDESASPRSLDWVKFSTADGTEVPTLHAIYRLDGEKLIIRSGGFNDDRPKVFEKGGEGCWTDVLVFNRPESASKTTPTSSDR